MTSTPPPSAPGRRAVTAVKRRLLVATGASLVGVGAVGIVVPGLPTTVFLILASYCFSKSHPELTDRWLRRGMFAKYMRYVDEGHPMPWHARVISLAFIWGGTALAVRAWGDPGPGISTAAAIVVAAACIGSVAVLVVRRGPAAKCPVVGLADSIAPPMRSARPSDSDVV